MVVKSGGMEDARLYNGHDGVQQARCTNARSSWMFMSCPWYSIPFEMHKNTLPPVYIFLHLERHRELPEQSFSTFDWQICSQARFGLRMVPSLCVVVSAY